MPPAKLGNDFKTIKIKCQGGHEVARYRKPRSEWGHRTHKLWFILERFNRLETEPPILVADPKTHENMLAIPETGTSITCGDRSCELEIGRIGIVGGTAALVLNENNLLPTKG